MGLFNIKKQNNKNSLSSIDTKKTLHKNLDFTASEQYRLLRTNIMFTLPENIDCPIIGVTSSLRGEGKSTTSINLSYVLAEKGSRILLIDGDLRIPSIAKKLQIPGKPGLTDLLINREFDIQDWQSDIHENLYILPSGDIPPNPSELLGSSRMQNTLDTLKEYFDYIVLDLPPINMVSDAMSVSNYITGLLLVIREGHITKKDLEECFNQIRLSNVNVLGCVMTNCKSSGGSYGKYKSKSYRYKAYENEED